VSAFSSVVNDTVLLENDRKWMVEISLKINGMSVFFWKLHICCFTLLVGLLGCLMRPSYSGDSIFIMFPNRATSFASPRITWTTFRSAAYASINWWILLSSLAGRFVTMNNCGVSKISSCKSRPLNSISFELSDLCYFCMGNELHHHQRRRERKRWQLFALNFQRSSVCLR
jgi:hypothetical protein